MQTVLETTKKVAFCERKGRDLETFSVQLWDKSDFKGNESQPFPQKVGTGHIQI